MQYHVTLCADPSTVSCEDTEYTNAIFPIGIIATLAFPVGVNLLYAALLFRHRAEIHSEKTEDASGSAVSFLHEPFTPSCFWWEPVDSVCVSYPRVAQTNQPTN